MFTTEIAYSHRSAFAGIPVLKETLDFKVNLLTEKAKEILLNVKTMLNSQSRTTTIVNASCVTGGFGIFGLSTYLLVSQVAIVAGTIGTFTSTTCSMISALGINPSKYGPECDERIAFIDLFQNFIDEPADLKVIPLLQCYGKIPGEKPCYSLLMHALIKAYKEKNIETGLTKQWTELLVNFREFGLMETDRFETLNVNFWAKFSLPPIVYQNYVYILSHDEKSPFNIPNILTNMFVKMLDEGCQNNLRPACFDRFECSVSTKEEDYDKIYA